LILKWPIKIIYRPFTVPEMSNVLHVYAEGVTLVHTIERRSDADGDGIEQEDDKCPYAQDQKGKRRPFRC
jgi:hypothetical protein